MAVRFRSDAGSSAAEGRIATTRGALAAALSHPALPPRLGFEFGVACEDEPAEGSPVLELCADPDGRVAARPEGVVWRPSRYTPAEHLLLASIEAVPRVARMLGTSAPPGSNWIDPRRAAAHWSTLDANLAALAAGLVQWQRRARHCGRCGAPMRPVQGGRRRRCSAGDCAEVQFPRLDPAVIVLLRYGGRVLLGRQPGWPPGRMSTFAGFVELGETIEQAVRRELAEEVGVAVRRLRYLGSQPWPFPSSLMLAFEAWSAGIEIELGAEIEFARWYTATEFLHALAGGELSLPSPWSISHALIDRWLRQSTGQGLASDENERHAI